MKKISVLLILALLICAAVQTPSQAGFFAEQKAKIEQNRIYKSTYNDIKNVIEQQNIYANKYDLKGLSNLYADDFVNSDGFNKDIYFKYCVNKRIKKLNSNYDDKLDKILSFIILNCNYDNMPIHILAKITLSISKVSAAISKGFINLIE